MKITIEETVKDQTLDKLMTPSTATSSLRLSVRLKGQSINTLTWLKAMRS